MSKSTYRFIFAVCIPFILQSCHPPENRKEASTVQEAKPVTGIAIVKKGRLSSSLKIPGELQPFQEVDLYAKVNSYVKKLYADVGSEVRQGQLLASLEAPEITSQLSASEAHLKSFEAIYIASKSNYERLLETSKTPGTISPNDLDIARARQNSDLAQYKAAQSAYEEIMNTRNYLQVRAPFSGIITARNVSQGAYVGPSGKGSDAPMFTLQTQRRLRLAVSVPEAYTPYLTDKSEATFTVVSLPGQVFKARINRLAGALDQRFRSERTEMDVLNDDRKLMPGMVAEIIIPLPAKESTLLVPAAAIVNSTERIYVIKITDGKAQWIDVQKGRISDKAAEVFGRLESGDTIIATGSEEVRNGMPVGKIELVSDNER